MATSPDGSQEGRAADGPPAFVFMLGTGRCGSSLVHEVLARHPEVGFVSNLDDRLAPLGLKGRGNSAIYRCIPPRFTEKGRPRFAPSEAYRSLDRHVSPAISVPCRDLTGEDATPWVAARLRRFFEDRARAQGKPVFLHKFTGWPRAGFLSEVFPEARFVHVVRDGRAVANSLLQMPWWRGYRGPAEWGWGEFPPDYAREWQASGRSFAILAGLEWKLLMDAFELARDGIPPGQWLEMRYEDFVTDPRERTEDLLRFVGLTWTDAFERGFRQYRFRTTRAASFYRDLSPADVDGLTASLAPHLGRHGYPVVRENAMGDVSS